MNHMTVSAQPRRAGRPKNTVPKVYITKKDGAYQVAARYPLNRRVYLGTYEDNQQALAAFTAYLNTGEAPKTIRRPRKEFRVTRAATTKFATAADWKRVYELRLRAQDLT